MHVAWNLEDFSAARASSARVVPLDSQGLFMGREANSLDPELEQHREFLHILARKHLDRRLWSRIGFSDVVQQGRYSTLTASATRFGVPNLLPWLVTASPE